MTFVVAMITTMLYAWWVGKETDTPRWFHAIVGLVWGLIVVYATVS